MLASLFRIALTRFHRYPAYREERQYQQREQRNAVSEVHLNILAEVRALFSRVSSVQSLLSSAWTTAQWGSPRDLQLVVRSARLRGALRHFYFVPSTA